MPTPDGTGPYASSTGQELISIERARQLHEKAITVQRDDAIHRVGALAHHAACYEEHGADPQPPPEWPGDDLEWRQQRNDVAALVRAGALYHRPRPRRRVVPGRDRPPPAPTTARHPPNRPGPKLRAILIPVRQLARHQE